MQAIILAAGMGKRLGTFTEHNTKCMVEVNGVTLIERMLQQLKKYGITKIIIVVGYQAQRLKAYIFPTFEEYVNRISKKNICAYTPLNSDYSYSIEEVIGFFEEKNIKNFILINPDNPSGNFIKKCDSFKFLDWAQKKSITVIVDESFLDFVEGASMNNSLLCDHILKKYQNLLVIKSISKSHGIPGLRLGIIASANIDLMENIESMISIWNINSLAEFYLQICGKYECEYEQSFSSFLKERDIFYHELCQISYLRVIPSHANFFLCEVLSKYTSFELTAILLDEHNILVKNCSSKQGFFNKNFVRIAIRNRSDNRFLFEALKKMENNLLLLLNS